MSVDIVGKTSSLPTNRVISLHCHVSYTSRGEGDYSHNLRVTPISTTPTAVTGVTILYIVDMGVAWVWFTILPIHLKVA